MESLLPLFIGLVVVVLAAVVFVPMTRSTMARKRGVDASRDAVTALAQEVGLTTTQLGADLVELQGELGRLAIGLVPKAEDSVIEVSAQLLTNGRLCLRPTGSTRAGPKTGPPTPTGDSAFDSKVEVLGANRALQAALIDPDFKALVRRVILDMAGLAVGGSIVVQVPSEAPLDELRDTLTTIVKLARWVNEPSGPREFHLEAPLVPPFHGGDDSDRGRAFVEHVGAVGDGKVVEGDDGWEWRGQVGELPLRVVVEDEEVWLQANVASPIENVELFWLPSDIPDPDGDEWDEEDADVFVGYGVILSKSYSIDQDGDALFERRCLEWARIPESVRAEIVGCMAKFDVHELIIEASGWRANMRRKVDEMFYPDRQVRGIVQTIIAVAPELAKLSPLPRVGSGQAVQVEIAQVHRHTCGYCRSVFVWTEDARCPNCGGAVQSGS